jgi:hypothetical protein
MLKQQETTSSSRFLTEQSLKYVKFSKKKRVDVKDMSKMRKSFQSQC